MDPEDVKGAAPALRLHERFDAEGDGMIGA
jgi:hypothetical protein